jgi:hypothetical protein
MVTIKYTFVLIFCSYTRTQQETIHTKKNEIRQEIFSKTKKNKTKPNVKKERDLHNNKKRKTERMRATTDIYGIDVYYLLLLLFCLFLNYKKKKKETICF